MCNLVECVTPNESILSLLTLIPRGRRVKELQTTFDICTRIYKQYVHSFISKSYYFQAISIYFLRPTSAFSTFVYHLKVTREDLIIILCVNLFKGSFVSLFHDFFVLSIQKIRLGIIYDKHLTLLNCSILYSRRGERNTERLYLPEKKIITVHLHSVPKIFHL